MQEQLTSREQQIFDLLLAGNSSKEIASKLSITYKTVDFHRSNVYHKLGVGSMRELLAKSRPMPQPAPPAPAAPPALAPFSLTLGNDEPFGWNNHFVPPALYNTRLTAGDIYTFSYTVTSDADFGILRVYFMDLARIGADGHNTFAFLSAFRIIVSNVTAHIEYNGRVTVILNQTASSLNTNANLFVVDAQPFVPGQPPPTLTFSQFEFEKAN